MTSQTPSLSFEVFPPNPAVGNEKILRALEDMQGLAPHFISVTASNNKYNIKETTVPLADHIQNDLAIPTIAHLPAIYLSKEKVADTLRDLDTVGVHRILALRGDIIPGVEPLKDFKYATDLIEFIRKKLLNLISSVPAILKGIQIRQIKSLISKTLRKRLMQVVLVF